MKKRITFTGCSDSGFADCNHDLYGPVFDYKLFQGGHGALGSADSMQDCFPTRMFDDSDNTKFHFPNIMKSGRPACYLDCKDGTVLFSFDNDMDIFTASKPQNRPEVKKALFQGGGRNKCPAVGFPCRWTYYHYALRLKTGTVIRVATQARSVYSVFLAASSFV